MLREIAALVGPEAFDMDPIAVFERMAAANSQIACAPLIYGYANYAMRGFGRIGWPSRISPRPVRWALLDRRWAAPALRSRLSRP